MVIPTQLEAGLRRHEAKPPIKSRLVFEDDKTELRVMETRDGNILMQVEKKAFYHVLLRRK